MLVKSLRLFNFRNLSHQTVEFFPGLNVVSGSNGQGKTNLIEAVSFLSDGRSFRGAAPREFAAWGAPACSVFALVEKAEGELEIGVAVEGGKKTGVVSGKRVQRFKDYIGAFISVTFVPDDLMIVKGAPAERRRFVDRHLVDVEPNNFQLLFKCQSVIRSKQELLRVGRASPKELSPWNQLIAAHGVDLSRKRVDFVAAIDSRSREFYHTFAPSEGELKAGVVGSFVDGSGTKSVEEAFKMLESAAQKEIAAKRALIGPHRDDVTIKIGEKSARTFASRGQTRSTVLALKLATVGLIKEARAESPVILLDDVESELDRTRKEALMEVIGEVGNQVFLTGTESLDSDCHFKGGVTSYTIVNGIVTKV